MVLPIDPRLIIALLWITICALLFFSLLRHPQRPMPRVALALVVAFIVRLIAALVLPNGAEYEMYVFHMAGHLTLTGQSVYLSDIAHPYLPLQIYWMAAANWFSLENGLLFFAFWAKLPNIIAEVGLVWMLYLALRRLQNEPLARWSAWLYAFNPVTILVAAYQGQFDAIPLLLMVIAWYTFTFHNDRRSGQLLSPLALGAAILSKTWPLLLLPILWLRMRSWRQRLTYPLLAASVPVLGILLYEALFPGSLFSILRRATWAGSIPGWWGYSSLMNIAVALSGQGQERFLELSSLAKNVAYLLGALTILITWRRPAIESWLLTILVLYAAAPNIGVQGLSWLIPMALLNLRHHQLGWYAFGSLLWMVIAYWGLHLNTTFYQLWPELWGNIIIQATSVVPWLIVVLWLLQEGTGRQLLPSGLFTRRMPPAPQGALPVAPTTPSGPLSETKTG
jgi:hypothetical protein